MALVATAAITVGLVAPALPASAATPSTTVITQTAQPMHPNGPGGATAKCRDGSYSHSKHRRGTCSHHHGVARWY